MSGAPNPFMKLMAAKSPTGTVAQPAGPNANPKSSVAESKPIPTLAAPMPIKPKPTLAGPVPVPVKTLAQVPVPAQPLGKITPKSVANPLTSLMAGPQTHEVMPAVIDENPDGSMAVHSVQQLAGLDTDAENMLPVEQRRPNLNVKAEEMAKRMVLDSGEKVKDLCDLIDAKIESAPMLAGPALVELRGYVQTLMVTLKERPEFDGFVIDRDARNVVRFIRAVQQETLQLRDVKLEKKATREANKTKKTAKGGGLDSLAARALASGAFKI